MIFDEYVSCLKWDPPKGEKDLNEEVDYYVLRRKSHEMLLQRVYKLALMAFDDKRKNLNIIGSEP